MKFPPIPYLPAPARWLRHSPPRSFCSSPSAAPAPLPRPPSLDLPETVKDLTAQRIGDDVHLHWTTPTRPPTASPSKARSPPRSAAPPPPPSHLLPCHARSPSNPAPPQPTDTLPAPSPPIPPPSSPTASRSSTPQTAPPASLPSLRRRRRRPTPRQQLPAPPPPATAPCSSGNPSTLPAADRARPHSL